MYRPQAILAMQPDIAFEPCPELKARHGFDYFCQVVGGF
jgi:hypothetical protein